MDNILKDIRHSYRALVRNPGFTAIAVLSLALGIGANTAIFSFIDTVLLKNLPVRDPQSLVVFGNGRSQGIWGGAPDAPMELFSWEQYQNFRKQNSVFSDVIAINSRPARVYVTMSGEKAASAPEPVMANLVSGNYFDALGLQPAIGRFFDSNADKAGTSPWIVLNEGYWERRFHRSPSAIGEQVRLNGLSWTVIGVAPRGFFGTRIGESPDIWIPASMQDAMPGSEIRGLNGMLEEPLIQYLNLFGRLKPGVSMTQADANVKVLYRRMLTEEAKASTEANALDHIRRASVHLTPGAKGLSGFRGRYETPLEILMVVVALVLVIACANVANLLLSLAARRQKEFALRVAIGAGRFRLIRQLLTESLMLSGFGGLLGILFASAAGKLLVHLISTGPRDVPLDFNLDQRVLAFTVAVSVVTGMLFGIVPALRASRVDLNSSLKEAKASMASPRKVTFGRVLVAGQVALSLGLLVTAGLLLHSFGNLISEGTGFERQNVLLFKMDSESSGYQPDQRLLSLYRQIEEKVSRLPGVGSEGVSMSSFGPGQRMTGFTAAGVNLPDEERQAYENFVSPGYFAVMRIPLILGRTLQSTDTGASQMVGVVSESFANAIFGGPANALGRTFQEEPNDKPIQIVGVVKDTKVRSVKDKNVRLTYRSVYQVPNYLSNLAVRVSENPARVAAEVRRTIESTERNLPIRWTTTLADEVSDSLVQERAIAQLSTFFALLALILAAVGLYGTISFAVARRTNEIGIRMALGAERAGVLAMVLRDAMLLAALGMAIGLPLALIATRQMAALLYGLGKVDAISVVGAVAALSLVAAVAGYLPARRAAAVDPMVALRYE